MKNSNQKPLLSAKGLEAALSILEKKRQIKILQEEIEREYEVLRDHAAQPFRDVGMAIEIYEKKSAPKLVHKSGKKNEKALYDLTHSLPHQYTKVALNMPEIFKDKDTGRLLKRELKKHGFSVTQNTELYVKPF